MYGGSSMICSKCQHENMDGSLFCNNCGQPLNATNNVPNVNPPVVPNTVPYQAPTDGYGVSGQYGTQYAQPQQVNNPPYVGAPVVNYGQNQIPEAPKSSKGSKKLIIAIVSVIVAVSVLIGVGVVVDRKVINTPYKIMETGNYEKAYRRASDYYDQCQVMYENLAAVCCADLKSGLDYPDSLEIINIWEHSNLIAIEYRAKDSSGKSQQRYACYAFDTFGNNGFEFDFFYDENEEPTSDNVLDSMQYDLEGYLVNLAIECNYLNSDAASRINELSHNGGLYSVKLLDGVNERYQEMFDLYESYDEPYDE